MNHTTSADLFSMNISQNILGREWEKGGGRGLNACAKSKQSTSLYSLEVYNLHAIVNFGDKQSHDKK